LGSDGECPSRSGTSRPLYRKMNTNIEDRTMNIEYRSEENASASSLRCSMFDVRCSMFAFSEFKVERLPYLPEQK
jgi:hypothetical protein